MQKSRASRTEQDGAGDRCALFLASGQRDSALAHQGLIAVGKAFDIARQPGHFRSQH